MSVISKTSTAIDAAVSFLLKNQDGDGAWRDFRVRPGRSDAWSTAYIAMKLRCAEHTCSNSDIEARLDRAAQFLLAARTKDGWGYNDRCAADADTTARAILFLRAMDYGVNPQGYASLAKFQTPCGGFATYRMTRCGHGWERAHPDVTAVALRALCGFLDERHDILRRALASLAAHLKGPHGSDSFWWRSRFYLAMEVRKLAKVLPTARSLPLPHGPISSDNFDVALALEFAAGQEESMERVESLRYRLLAQCRADGSWTSGPILRITDPRAQDFGDEFFVASPFVVDDRRLFTTATALGALVSSDCEAH
jgi:hypothetical protein